MPLPAEILQKIKEEIENAKAGISTIEDVLSDLRAAGIDASAQEAMLVELKKTLNQMRLFYDRQSKRPRPE